MKTKGLTWQRGRELWVVQALGCLSAQGFLFSEQLRSISCDLAGLRRLSHSQRCNRLRKSPRVPAPGK